MKISSKNYILTFAPNGVSVLFTDIAKDMFVRLDGLFTLKDGQQYQYFTVKKYKWAADYGLKFYSSTKKVKAFEKEVSKSQKDLALFFKSISKNKISRMQAEKFFKDVVNLCRLYSLLNVEYTEKAYLLQDKNKNVAHNLVFVAKFKDKFRDFLNEVLFNDKNYLELIVKKLSRQFEISENKLQYYTQKEIIDLFFKKEVSSKIIEQRKLAFVAMSLNNKTYYFQGKEGQKIASKLENKNYLGSSVHGQVANTGKVKGRVKVIPINYGNFKLLLKEIAKMKKGDILVAQTTAPELILACKKASAIVTDLGGMMSHAAIVSRELNIPCIVGTNDATKVFKDGDMVEVDANKGIVKKL